MMKIALVICAAEMHFSHEAEKVATTTSWIHMQLLYSICVKWWVVQCDGVVRYICQSTDAVLPQRNPYKGPQIATSGCYKMPFKTPWKISQWLVFLLDLHLSSFTNCSGPSKISIVYLVSATLFLVQCALLIIIINIICFSNGISCFCNCPCVVLSQLLLLLFSFYLLQLLHNHNYLR